MGSTRRVGALVDHIDEQGLAENTIVLYVTDNGWVQNPTRRGRCGRRPRPSTRGWWTPIMIRWPGRVSPRMSEELAMSIDLLPTILATVGLERDAGLPGLNLLDDAAVRARRHIYGACFTHNAVDLNDPAKNVMYRWIIDEGQEAHCAGEGGPRRIGRTLQHPCRSARAGRSGMASSRRSADCGRSFTPGGSPSSNTRRARNES